MADFFNKVKSMLGGSSAPAKATVGGVRKEIERLKSENSEIAEKWDRAGKAYEAGRGAGLGTRLEEAAIDKFSKAHEYNKAKIERYQKAVDKSMAGYHTNMAKKYQARNSSTPLAETQFND
ncbi:MAG: hypothetical protein RIR01_2076 [Bacteroidota bacterium]|jgi:ribosomal protein S17E